MSDNPFAPTAIIEAEKKVFLEKLIQKGGPELHEYETFTSIVNSLDPSLTDQLRELLSPMLNENTLIGYGLKKPFGYPGDFNLINNIYDFHVNENEEYRNWDIFFQNQAGAVAVRNRKEYFLNYCKDLAARKEKDINVLILGSGPATDVYEFLDRNPENHISFDLIDFDQNAIDFSRRQNAKFDGLVSYNRINVLRFKPYKIYDLIWSAGLFDYFRDKHFVFLIKKYISFLADRGDFIISNFSTENPTRRLMEVLSEWYLNHRSTEDLLRIASEAGIDKRHVTVDTEPLGVNLFLRINREAD